MDVKEAYKEFFGVEPADNGITVNYSVLAFAEHYAKLQAGQHERVDEKYKGLEENLERFKNDFSDEKTKLLFSIAYKQGYEAAEIKKDETMNKKEKLEELLGEIKKSYSSIMSEARKIFQYQDSLGNPYAMHKAYEYAKKELENLNNLNLDVEYRISILKKSEEPKNLKDFNKKLYKKAAKNGEGTFGSKINGIYVTYKVFVVTLTYPTDNYGY